MTRIGPSAFQADLERNLAHHFFRKLSLAIFALLFVGFLASSAQAATLKDVEASQIHNLSSFEEADQFAINFAAKIKAANIANEGGEIGTKNNPLRLYHVHKTFSRHVERALLKLLDLGVVVESHHIDPDTVLEDIADVSGFGANYPMRGFMGMGDFQGEGIDVKSMEPVTEAEAIAAPEGGPRLDSPKVWDRVGGMMKNGARKFGNGLRYLFKIPGGFSLWMSIPRTPEAKKKANKIACISATTALCSISLSFAIGGRPIPEIIGAGIGLWAWVWSNLYWMQTVQEIMAQGKSLALTNGKVVGFKRAIPFMWTANFVRGLLTNAAILTASFGVAALTSLFFSGDAQPIIHLLPKVLLGIFSVTSLSNAVTNVFARSQVDAWITNKSPSPKDPPGTQKKLTQNQANKLRAFWEFGYGLIKNLDLIKKSSGGGAVKTSAIIYRVMAGPQHGLDDLGSASHDGIRMGPRSRKTQKRGSEMRSLYDHAPTSSD